MKILLPTVTVIVMFISFASCEKAKDWNCKCTYTEDGVDKVRNNVLHDRKKKDAQAMCTINLVGPTATNAKCNLE